MMWFYYSWRSQSYKNLYSSLRNLYFIFYYLFSLGDISSNAKATTKPFAEGSNKTSYTPKPTKYKPSSSGTTNTSPYTKSASTN